TLESAQSAHKRADVLAAGGRDVLAPKMTARLAALAEHLQADDEDRRVAVELDRIRLESSSLGEGTIQLRLAGPKLVQVFSRAGYDIVHGKPTELAARIRESPIRLALLAGLDFWALAVDDQRVRARLLEIARSADSDPWRDRFRQLEVWHNQSK